MAHVHRTGGGWAPPGSGPGVRRRTARVLAALLIAAPVAACTIQKGPFPGGTSSPGGGPSVLAVKIDNVRAARPPTGLEAADVVYAEQVEAGLSRLLAVYASRIPADIGPVRSARESDLELLRQFDRVSLAYSGVQTKLRPLLAAAPLTRVSPGQAPDAFHRSDTRPSPHNLYVRPARIPGPAPVRTAAAETGFRFGPAPSGGRAESTYSVRFPAARFGFTWSKERQAWQVSMDGAASRTSAGGRLAASTVVVQYVKVGPSRFGDRSGNNTPYTETVGTGEAVVLRDGRAYDARWNRATPQDGTEYTTGDGRTLPFAKGQVWVVLAKR
ncbi:DUF3048 domain-containing protein [Streptomyces tsukubensis]|uniref:DUF3048 domain-containing protein n=1 Tax=Streptomyces tsukubensis TaxID=83656 RepID=A0A1V4ACU7_9ACTN|nr:DUF3048 domain-containing protein [Streptomyces tsukubensis]OON81804.1 hypothetical protein B1H18_06770 [Streptomyces tsukubensis]QFR96593.1 DUF3048 domain-containing protein [Streptomyces tsukubensis]